jgi:transposase-like protein
VVELGEELARSAAGLATLRGGERVAPSEAAARERFMEFDARWGKQYPAISKLWENAWSEFIPFLDTTSRSGA